MSEGGIKATVNLEFSDFFRNIFWRSFRILLLFFIWAVVVGYYSVTGVINSQNISLVSFLPVIPALIFLLVVFEIYYKSKKGMAHVKGEIRYMFFDEGYTVNTSVSSSTLKWESLDEIKETGKDFLLFYQKPRFVIVPKRSFSGESQVEKFKELVRETLGKKAKLKK